MIRVEDDGDTVCFGDGTDVVGCCDGSGDGGLLFVVGEAFSGKVGGASLGYLEDDGGFDVAGKKEDGMRVSCVRRDWVRRTVLLRGQRLLSMKRLHSTNPC